MREQMALTVPRCMIILVHILSIVKIVMMKMTLMGFHLYMMIIRGRLKTHLKMTLSHRTTLQITRKILEDLTDSK
ncbi:hypothetical protein Hamer_G001360, partial [Homarus americanus]